MKVTSRGGSSGDGISPLIGTYVRFFGSTRPTSASSACVYGWFGAAKSADVGAVSTMRPRYMTTTRSDRPDDAEIVADEQIGEVQRPLADP